MKKFGLGYFLLGLLFFGLSIRALYHSRFFRPYERVQVVVYGENTRFYSLHNSDKIHYYATFSPDTKIIVPNGYKYYRIGALGRLIYYDRTADLLKKGFSAATSTFVQYYFYPANTTIYYGNEAKKEIRLPSFKELFLYQTNAPFVDRLYLALKFLNTKKSDFTVIDESATIKKQRDDYIFSEKDFAKKFLGYFYQKTYRKERRTVQIIYTEKYNSADLIGKILEGNGIRVIDLKQMKQGKNCFIIEQADQYSITAQDLADFFGCQLKKGKTEISDIIFMLGNIEEDWEI